MVTRKTKPQLAWNFQPCPSPSLGRAEGLEVELMTGRAYQGGLYKDPDNSGCSEHPGWRMHPHTGRATHPNSTGTEAPGPRPSPKPQLIYFLSTCSFVSFTVSFKLVNVSATLSCVSCSSKLTEPKESVWGTPIYC